MSNSNNDENYQYINQQTTYIFRTHDQYRSCTRDKRHRQTVHNQTLTLYAAHQSESKGRVSMELKRNITTKSTIDMENTVKGIIIEIKMIIIVFISEANVNSMGSPCTIFGCI